MSACPIRLVHLWPQHPTGSRLLFLVSSPWRFHRRPRPSAVDPVRVECRAPTKGRGNPGQSVMGWLADWNRRQFSLDRLPSATRSTTSWPPRSSAEVCCCCVTRPSTMASSSGQNASSYPADEQTFPVGDSLCRCCCLLWSFRHRAGYKGKTAVSNQWESR